jgi:predicted ArsR family transcriptional regulator
MPPDDLVRHAMLADPTRRALLEALGDAPGPVGVGELAGRLGLHRNSVREQLGRLAAAGLVRVSRSAPAGRGRPGLRYEPAPEPEDPYRTLAEVLADQVAALPDPAAAWTAAGERWGRSAAAATTASDTRSAATEARAAEVLSDLLDRAGFAPDPVSPDDPTVRLRACPFLPIDRRHLDVVCGVHLGFIRGVLRELGSSRDATSIEPLVEPGLCVAHLGRTPDA